MYESYWGLRASPFRGGRNVRFWHESALHAEALARLLYLVENRRSLGVICGADGCGKSQVLATASERLARSQRRVVTVDLTGLDGAELARAALDNLQPARITCGSTAGTWRAIADDLAAARLSELQTVVLLDSYDRSATGCPEAVERLIATAGASEWLTIIVATRPTGATGGRREFEDACELRIEVEPFDRLETARYVTGLFRQAGGREGAFHEQALATIHRLSGGVPRVINRLCDLALLAAVSDEATAIDAECIELAAEELGLDDSRHSAPPHRRLAASASYELGLG